MGQEGCNDPIQAAGFVLYRCEEARPRYLLLRNARHGDVGLAKGKLDPGEEPLQAALRETREETGIDPGALAVKPWFRRRVRYVMDRGPKEVTYLLARTLPGAPEVRLSPEHNWAGWLEYAEARRTLRHDNLRLVLDAAATYIRDPALRGGRLAPAQARELLVRQLGPETRAVAHSRVVAGLARRMAEAWGGLQADDVEAAAWVHDIGRARTHGARHALEGFRIVVAEGYPGYAPACLTHYTKGRGRTELGGDPELLDAMWAACDLDAFPIEERLIALADFMVVGDRPARLEERHADLCARYGSSRFFDASLAAAERLKRQFESHAATPLYSFLPQP